jgi:tetratricopeptide (TPR) repeat protein
VEPAARAEPSPLEQLLQQAGTLAAAAQADADTLPALLAVYESILEIDPQQPEALAGINSIKQQVLQPVLEQFPDGDMDLAEQLRLQVLADYPAFANDPDYQGLEQRIETQRSLNDQLALADQYLAQNKLMAPAGENAREAYEAVLAAAPDNTRARAGLENIAIRYRQLALASQQRGEYSKAMTLVARGLSINEDDLALAALADELKDQVNVQQYIAGLLAQAQEFKNKGIWFQPENSAAQRYLQVLSLEPGQQQARQGVQALVAELTRQLEVQLQLRNFTEAAALLKPAQALLPQNQQLQQLAANLQASQPKVAELAFSSSQDFAAQEIAAGKVKAGRTLYIRFQYSNFNPATTVLQALLFDGGRTVQIAGVPVIVNGEQGSSSFRIDRPVEGFKEGGYHMDILLDGKRIASGEFVVAPYE